MSDITTPATTNGAGVNSTFADNASAAYDAAANHPLTQNVKETIANGPVAENVKDQTLKTQSEFSNLAASRTTPSTPAATGQQLTHYHSFFSSLLSWDNPRASGIAFASIVLFIFGARYLNLLRYAFRLSYIVLAITVSAELAGKALFASGFTSQIRPKKYYILPKETLDSMIGDVHELINFFVIEAQRIVFAENIWASAAACVASFLSYFLIKLVPFWGFSLIATSVLFLTPLAYKTNKDLIDHQLEHVSVIVNQQTEQVKSLASHHAAVAANTTKQYVGDYSAKAQEIIGGRARSQSPVATKAAPGTESAVPMKEVKEVKEEKIAPEVLSVPLYKSTDFPDAPQEPFVKSTPIANEFITAPSIQDTASTLRNEDEPVPAL